MDGPVECFPMGASRRKPKFLIGTLEFIRPIREQSDSYGPDFMIHLFMQYGFFFPPLQPYPHFPLKLNFYPGKYMQYKF